jgi:coenzyme F420 hydrogenase subunit beta
LKYIQKLQQNVVDKNRCFGCGLCTAPFNNKKAFMKKTNDVPIPVFNLLEKEDIDLKYYKACPGLEIDYYELYQKFYKSIPSNWYSGIVRKSAIGYSLNQTVRLNSSSGGIISEVLIYLLENKLIDAAILVKQGTIDSPKDAKYFFARNKRDILDCSQSIYTPVSTLDSLKEFVPNENYAITCLPEQSAAIRYLQVNNDKTANQIKYVLGPYTGTSLNNLAIDALLRMSKIKSSDLIKQIKWRAGEWPGKLKIEMNSGKVIESEKIYYNFLIPFYISNQSMQSYDFVNEFADLSVGDAWSPKYESIKKGFSVVISRNDKMNKILDDMKKNKIIELSNVEKKEILNMHGHMIDFKKRGSYIRKKFKNLLGQETASNGLRPDKISFLRYCVEFLIIFIFKISSLSISRRLLEMIPIPLLGPFFNRLRLLWKDISKPIKRNKLSKLNMVQTGISNSDEKN